MRLFKNKKTKLNENTLIENEDILINFDDDDSDYIEIHEGGSNEEFDQNTLIENENKKHSLDYFLQEAEEYARSKQVSTNNNDFDLFDR